MIESNMWYNVWFHKNQFCHKLCQNWCQNWCHIWYHYLDLNISPSLFSRINSDFFQKKPKIAHFWYRKSNETGIIFELKKLDFDGHGDIGDNRMLMTSWRWQIQNVGDSILLGRKSKSAVFYNPLCWRLFHYVGDFLKKI